MATTLRTIFLILLYAFIMQMQYNLDADKTATRQIKNNLEIAVHDASLAVDQTQYTQNGRVVFEQAAALQNIENSLDTNLDLTSSDGYTYTPTANSFFKSNLKIVDLEFIDDNVTTTYPYVYSNPQYDILEQVNGPSVIAVLTTQSPRWFTGSPITIRQGAVYQYKPY